MKKIHHFITSAQPPQITDSRLIHHLQRVLKIDVGEEIVLCDGVGTVVRCRIETQNASVITVKVIERTQHDPLPERTLYAALIKPHEFELIVQKAAELGVTCIVPLITERTTTRRTNHTRLCTIVREATELSERAWLPEVKQPQLYADALERAQHSGTCIVLDATGVKQNTRPSSTKPSAMFVGPEGGWSERELAHARDARCLIVSLGTQPVRAETAAIIGAYLLTA